MTGHQNIVLTSYHCNIIRVYHYHVTSQYNDDDDDAAAAAAADDDDDDDSRHLCLETTLYFTVIMVANSVWIYINCLCAKVAQCPANPCMAVCAMQPDALFSRVLCPAEWVWWVRVAGGLRFLSCICDALLLRLFFLPLQAVRDSHGSQRLVVAAHPPALSPPALAQHASSAAAAAIAADATAAAAAGAAAAAAEGEDCRGCCLQVLR